MDNRKMNILFVRATIATVLVVSLFFFYDAQQTRAGKNETGFGWIWSGSENSGGDTVGFGWVSANSVNCDNDDNGESDGGVGCPSAGTTIANYGITIPEATNPDQKLNGYAWSERVGWISFRESDVSGCPTGPCSAYRSGNDVRGWARILSIPDGGVNDGNFEGWIKLHSESGDPVSYGVSLNESVIPKEVSGYAWSDEFGWLDFSRMLIGPIPDLIICPSAITIAPDASLQTVLYIGLIQGRAACADVTSLTAVTTDAGTEWASVNDGIATVDNGVNKGLLRGVAAGSTIITASYKSLTANAYITVAGVSSPTCGNGIVDGAEVCDDGASGNGTCDMGATCSPSCTLNVCTCVL